mgnify:CR=1 FL=1
MSAMKDLVMDIITLYREGYTVLGIARELKLSMKEVNEVVCNYITPTTKE